MKLEEIKAYLPKTAVYIESLPVNQRYTHLNEIKCSNDLQPYKFHSVKQLQHADDTLLSSMTNMTLAEYIRVCGLVSIKNVSEITDTSRQTLNNWYKFKPVLFNVLIAGCLSQTNTPRITFF